MIKGVGVDLIEIERIKQAVKKHGQRFLDRVYTAQEIYYCSLKSAYLFPELAVRFAAKEAYAKALGTGINKGIFWRDIEVRNNKLGQPHIYLKGKKTPGVQLSLSHSHNNAVAMVVIEG